MLQGLELGSRTMLPPSGDILFLLVPWLSTKRAGFEMGPGEASGREGVLPSWLCPPANGSLFWVVEAAVPASRGCDGL